MGNPTLQLRNILDLILDQDNVRAQCVKLTAVGEAVRQNLALTESERVINAWNLS